MKRLPAEVLEEFRVHHGVVSRRACLAAGMTAREISGRLQRGEWERMYAGAYRLTTQPLGPLVVLAAACAAAGPGAVVSHRSAAWCWGMRPHSPPTPALSLGAGRDRRIPGVEVHRVADLRPVNVRTRGRFFCTDPLRTIVDVAAVASPAELDDVLDRALAKSLVTVAGIAAEMGRLRRRGRRGIGPLSAALTRRGLVGAPAPSVLESRLARVLHRAGIVPLGTEVVVVSTTPGPGASAGDSGRAPLYRLDVLLAPRLAVEVDGYRYHHSPGHKAADERRRNQIRLGGIFLLVYTWWDVLHEPQRIIAEIRAAMAAVA